MSAQTTGPWKINKVKNDWVVHSGKHGLHMIRDNEEDAIKARDEANKRHADEVLRDAAPDLLEALEALREFIDGQIDVVDGDYGVPEPTRAMSLATMADAAIAKATGAA